MLPTHSSRGWLGCLAVLAGFLVQSPATRAEEPQIKVKVVAILATDQNKKVDPRLQKIAQKVREKEPSLTGFKMGRCSCASLTTGKEVAFELVDDQVVRVMLKSKAEKEGRVCLTIKPPRMGPITYETACDKFFPIVTRYQTKDKERLIIAIMVPPCGGK